MYKLLVLLEWRTIINIQMLFQHRDHGVFQSFTECDFSVKLYFCFVISVLTF